MVTEIVKPESLSIPLFVEQDEKYPFYHLVPKQVDDNIEFRRMLVNRGARDPEFAKAERARCAADLMYYINAYIWTYDPRDKEPRRPFVSWPRQDEVFDMLSDSVGHHDFVGPKARDVGLSWMCLLVIDHLWRFRDFLSFMLVSRNEDLVDDAENTDSLMWKLDFVHKWLPPWLKPQRKRSALHIYNIDTGSTIDGASTTGNVGRGGRRTVAMLDEFAAFRFDDGFRALAATQNNARTRWFPSSPQGVGNAFHEMYQLALRPDTPARACRVSWMDCPDKAAGLYRVDKGRVVRLDPNYEHPDGYPFVHDGKIRSPYYDEECSRTPLRSLIASELDIEFIGSGHPFFTGDDINYCKKYCRKPFHRGEISHSADAIHTGKTTFVANDRGCFKLWTRIDGFGNVSNDRSYVIGVDVSAGTGASSSVIVVGDLRTGEKVLEYVNAHVSPHELADLTMVLGRWFRNDLDVPAYAIWEHQGPGSSFGKRLMEKGYGHVYYKQLESRSPYSKKSKTPGFHVNKQLKRDLLVEFARAAVTGDLVDRSEDSVEQCAEYEYDLSGEIVHTGSHKSLDPSGARANHGDVVMATALLWWGMKDLGFKKKLVEPEAPIMSRKDRMERRKRESKMVKETDEMVFA